MEEITMKIENKENEKHEKAGEKESYANLHPLKARLYDNVHLSLNTMNIIVGVVAVLLVAVFFYGVLTGSTVQG